MKTKLNFTLMELIISIVVLGILLAIIIVNINSSKKNAIRVAVQANTSIIQTSVDTYYIKENKTPPTIKREAPTLEKPTLIDVDYLAKKGFIKKGLDLSKIKEQYYWLDSFGRVWGATEREIKPVTVLDDGSKGTMSFLLSKEYEGYSIYKINLKNGKYAAFSEKENLIASNQKVLKTSSYKQIYEENNAKNEERLITVKLLDPNAIYLVSAIDKYSLETVPVGFTDYGFKPLINKEGVFYYNLEMASEIIFKAFWDKKHTPGNSTVSYRFAVMDKNFKYGKYVDSFDDLLSLHERGYGIEIEITMKGDSEGNYPSVHELHVAFDFGEDEPKDLINYCKLNPEKCKPKEDICLINPEECQNPPSVFCDQYPHLCEVDTCENLSECPIPTKDLCGEGRTKSGIRENLTLIANEIKLEEGRKLISIPIPPKSDGLIYKGLELEFSYKGNVYKKVASLNDIPAGSCINIVYKYEKTTHLPPTPPVPPMTCKEDVDCPKTCEELNNCPKTCEELGNCDSSNTCEKLNNCPKPNEELTCVDLGNCSDPYKSCQELGTCEDRPCTENGNCPDPTKTCKDLGICSEPTKTCEELGDCPDKNCEELGNCPKDPEYITVSSRTYYAHAYSIEGSKWLGYRVEELNTEVEGARIIYGFSLGNGVSYGEESSTFPVNAVSKSIKGIAYFQVREDLIDKLPVPDLRRFVFQGDKVGIESTSTPEFPEFPDILKLPTTITSAGFSKSTFHNSTATTVLSSVAEGSYGGKSYVVFAGYSNFSHLAEAGTDSRGGYDGFFYIYEHTKHGFMNGKTLRMGGSGTDYINDVVFDNDGNFYVVGSTTSRDLEVNFKGDTDAFVAKYSVNGTLLWMKAFGGKGKDKFNAIALLPDGNLLAAGSTDSIDGDLKGTKTDTDIFVVKFNTSGVLSFAYRLGGTSTDSISDIHVESASKIHLVGNSNSPTFLNTRRQNADTQMDILYLNINSNGSVDPESVMFLGGNASEEGTSISVDSNGSIVIGGTLNCNKGVPCSIYGRNALGGVDGLVIRLTKDYKLSTVFVLGGAGNDIVSDVVTSEGEVYISGYQLSGNGTFSVEGSTEVNYFAKIRKNADVIDFVVESDSSLIRANKMLTSKTHGNNLITAASYLTSPTNRGVAGRRYVLGF